MTAYAPRDVVTPAGARHKLKVVSRVVGKNGLPKRYRLGKNGLLKRCHLCGERLALGQQYVKIGGKRVHFGNDACARQQYCAAYSDRAS